jgi:ubiquinone/menaquinone biosynthesis C-methylase UbiE
MADFSGIDYNIKAHDAVAATYEAAHGEIFNETEQARLRAKLAEAARLAAPGTAPLSALDMGCGSGNLTAHLLALGFTVTAADVSEKFLALVRGRFPGNPRLKTVRLNGRDLSVFKDSAFDFTATYSVLHHVPDYLGIVREMARVTAPGGIVYLDHEANPGHWPASAVYEEFTREARGGKEAPAPKLSRFLKLSTYVNKFRQLLNPRYIIEGDIHVWPDDHIEWDQIEKALAEAGLSPVLKEDYLLYRRGCPAEVYARYKDLCSDMRLLAARKR